VSDLLPFEAGAEAPKPLETHEPAPEAHDVSSALHAMKQRLASTRQAQAAVPESPYVKPQEVEKAEAIADSRPKTAKPPEVWEYRAGQSVFREGELTYELFMLMEGAVDIIVGQDKVASLDSSFAAGAYLGEIGSLLRTPRTATVKATAPCKFLVFPDARRLFEEDPEFGIKLSVTLAQRLSQSNERMDLVMRALYRAKVKDEVIDAVKGAFQGKESTYVGKKGLFG
jgi:hypothetical protein